MTVYSATVARSITKEKFPWGWVELLESERGGTFACELNYVKKYTKCRYRDADKSLARSDWKKIESSPFFVQRGGHCCSGDLVGRTTFRIVFGWLAKVRVWSL